MSTAIKEPVNDANAEAAKMAAAAGLVYVSDADPGIRRLRKRRTFAYIKPDDRPLVATSELARIARLAIPPAYEEVWICTDPRGHLQATGRDARRRKQYRYHPEWRAMRDATKFDRMAAFARVLPSIRSRLADDLGLRGMPR